ncbi:DUF551 domain-containing protein [Salmonella enterica]|nr:DUF551 domain-containing protein [Salmonella enterica]
MTTITNKKQYPSEQYLNELITNMEFAARAPVEVVRAMAAELQERRKADNQEPAGYHVIRECGKIGCSVATLEEAEKTRDFWNKRWTIRPYFYSATPVVPPAIEPDYKVIKSILPTANPDEYACCIAADMWNACRTAMLQGSQPVSNHDELPYAQVKAVADLYALCWQSGEVVTYTPDPEKATIWLNNYSGTCVQEYVKLERLQEALAGNSPAIPDGWIPVSERMPENKPGSYEYIVFESLNNRAHHDYWNVPDGSCDDFSPFWNHYGKYVTHWMPLPAAPQQEVK